MENSNVWVGQGNQRIFKTLQKRLLTDNRFDSRALHGQTLLSEGIVPGRNIIVLAQPGKLNVRIVKMSAQICRTVGSDTVERRKYVSAAMIGKPAFYYGTANWFPCANIKDLFVCGKLKMRGETVYSILTYLVVCRGTRLRFGIYRDRWAFACVGGTVLSLALDIWREASVEIASVGLGQTPRGDSIRKTHSSTNVSVVYKDNLQRKLIVQKKFFYSMSISIVGSVVILFESKSAIFWCSTGARPTICAFETHPKLMWWIKSGSSFAVVMPAIL